MRSVLVQTVTEDLTDSTQAVNCPVLLLWGSDDTETPTWLGERYRELLGDRATLIVLPHKDHHSLYGGTGAHLCAFKIRQWMGA
jgi:pimeloyl-ACP methyl ester carboxylesterase